MTSAETGPRPGVEARPTMAMLAILGHLERTKGKLVRTMGVGWKIESAGFPSPTWSSTATVNGLRNRGWIDEYGSITKQGIAIVELYRK